MNSNMEGIGCTLLPGRWYYDQPVPDFYNRAYHFWRNTWMQIFLDAGSPESLNVDCFFRQHVLVFLHHEDEPIGSVLMSFFNLGSEASYDHSYIRCFPGEFLDRVKSESRGFVATMEYLSVDPRFRRSVLKLPLSEVLIGLGMKVSMYTGASLIVSTPIQSARVHKSYFKLGWVELGSVRKHVTDHVLMYSVAEQVSQHPEPAVESMINRYWVERRDWTGLTEIHTRDGIHRFQQLGL